jgi:hypothetical protein
LKKIIHVHKVVEKASAAQKHSDRLYISDLKTNNAAAFHKGMRKALLRASLGFKKRREFFFGMMDRVRSHSGKTILGEKFNI